MNNSYFAGLFDGEGCVGIRTMITKNCERGMTYAMYCKVGMTNKEVIERLKETYGGSVNLKSENRAGRQDVWTWCAVGSKAKLFLNSIKPYCIVKKEAIDNALAFQARLDNYTAYRVSSNEFAIRTEYYNIGRRLNARGVEALKIKEANSGNPVTNNVVGNPEPSWALSPGVCREQVLPAKAMVCSDPAGNRSSS